MYRLYFLPCLASFCQICAISSFAIGVIIDHLANVWWFINESRYLADSYLVNILTWYLCIHITRFKSKLVVCWRLRQGSDFLTTQCNNCYFLQLVCQYCHYQPWYRHLSWLRILARYLLIDNDLLLVAGRLISRNIPYHMYNHLFLNVCILNVLTWKLSLLWFRWLIQTPI